MTLNRFPVDRPGIRVRLTVNLRELASAAAEEAIDALFDLQSTYTYLLYARGMTWVLASCYSSLGPILSPSLNSSDQKKNDLSARSKRIK